MSHAGYLHAYAASLQPVFLIAALIGVLAFGLTWLLREVPLRATTRAIDPGETYAMPTARTSQDEIERALGVLASRESRQRIYERIAARAGLALDPPSCWLLVRIDQHTPVTPATLESLSARLHIPATTLTPVLDQLTQRGLVTVAGKERDVNAGQITLTPAGRQARDRLIAARRAGLATLLAGWSPDQQQEFAAALGRLAHSLLDDPGDRMPAGAPHAPAERRG